MTSAAVDAKPNGVVMGEFMRLPNDNGAPDVPGARVVTSVVKAMTDQRAGSLRIITALAIVAAMIAAGWLHRSPWTVVLATPAFTVLYALGKWNAWMAAWRAGGLGQAALALLVTLPIQAIVAGVCYLIGLGLGTLFAGNQPIAALSSADVMWMAVLLAVGVAAGAAIIRMEGSGSASPPSVTTEAAVAETPELFIDPAPLTLATFFKGPGYWWDNAARQALENRSTPVVKKPLVARDDMIAAAEERLGVRLPETLRALYRIMNGGYVGWLYVPLKADPKPVYDDWRGAFSIDYSSLAPLEQLRTVAEHYADFTDDPDEIPADAENLVVLQARYGDMTLLDYSRGPQPRVLIVDYDRAAEEPVDIAFEDFDAFFAALRRDRPDRDRVRRRAAVPDAVPFWGAPAPHAFHANAVRREDGSEPKLAADDALIAETQTRLGVTLPASLVTLWRERNGGAVSRRFLDDTEVMEFPVPLEYFVSLADLSDRIVFPQGDMPWKERYSGTDRLIVIEADRRRAVLLDYRDRPDGDPAVLLVKDLDEPLTDAIRIERWQDMLARLSAVAGPAVCD